MKKVALFMGLLMGLLNTHTSYAAVCPTGMVFRKTVANPMGECLCPSGQRAQMNISAGIKKFGGCPDTVTLSNSSNTPKNIAPNNIKLWLDADDPNNDGYRLSNGVSVTSWKDKSGQGNNATSSGTAPTYVTDSMNSRPIVRFAGTGGYTVGTSSAFHNGNQITIIAVMKPSNLAGTNGIFSTRSLDRAGSFDLGYGGNRVALATPGVWNALTAVNTLTSGRSYIITYTRNSTPTQAVYLNGLQQALTGSMVTFVTNNDTKLVGYRVNASPFYMSADLAELIVYNTALSEIQRTQVESYLMEKWGIYPHPAEIASGSLRLWLDANDPNNTGIAPATHNAAVSTWHDKSGSGYNGIQATASAQPRVQLGALNGKAVINFDGSDRMVAGNSAGIFSFLSNSGANHTVCMVIRTSATARAFLLHTGSGVTADYSMENTNQNISATSWNGGAHTYNHATTTQPFTLNTFKNVCEVLVSGVQSTIYVNGIAVSSLNTFGSVGPTNTAVGVSIASSASSTFYYTGDIAEILMYNTALSDAKRRLLEAYLAGKWGLQN